MTDPMRIANMFSPILSASHKTEKPKTEEDLKLLEEQKKQQEEMQKKQQEEARKKQLENEMAMLEMQLESAKEQSEAIEDSFSTFSKCMTIAHRITKGDKVPLKDMKYLMEHEPDLYKQAILMRQPNPKPKEHKSVLEEDDEQVSTEEYSQGGGETQPVSEMPAVQKLSESAPVSVDSSAQTAE